MKGKRKKNRTNKSFPRRQIKKPSKKKIQAPHWSSAANQKSRSLFSFFFAHEIFEEAEKRRLGRKITKKINERERERERERKSRTLCDLRGMFFFPLFFSFFSTFEDFSLAAGPFFPSPPQKKQNESFFSRESQPPASFCCCFLLAIVFACPYWFIVVLFCCCCCFFYCGPSDLEFRWKNGENENKKPKQKKKRPRPTDGSERNEQQQQQRRQQQQQQQSCRIFLFPFFSVKKAKKTRKNEAGCWSGRPLWGQVCGWRWRKQNYLKKKLGKLIKNIKMRNLGQIRVAASAETDQWDVR